MFDDWPIPPLSSVIQPSKWKSTLIHHIWRHMMVLSMVWSALLWYSAKYAISSWLHTSGWIIIIHQREIRPYVFFIGWFPLKKLWWTSPWSRWASKCSSGCFYIKAMEHMGMAIASDLHVSRITNLIWFAKETNHQINSWQLNQAEITSMQALHFLISYFQTDSAPTAACPACGHPHSFLWSGPCAQKQLSAQKHGLPLMCKAGVLL